MPKLLIVIARMNKGGTAQYVAQLAKELTKHNFQIKVATGFVQGQEIEDEVAQEIPVFRIKNLGRKISLFKDYKARRELKDLISIFKPDIIYSHTFKAGVLTRTIKTKIPLIHAYHGHLLKEPELKGLRIKVAIVIERFLAPRTKFLVSVGLKVATELLEVGIGKKSQFVSIAPGVKSLDLQNRKKARTALKLTEEKRPIVVWMARVVAVKAPERVIELAREIPRAKFLLAGGGDLLDDIKARAPTNLNVLGWKSANQMWAVADIGISTSENEGMPIALIEAQMAGVPIVALNVGSVSEVIISGKTGYVFEEFDSFYVSKLRTLIEDKNLRSELGKSAKKLAQKTFNTERFVQEHLNLFKRVL
jgi:glycosyltransferase involved in cell wall biosynthesis